MDILCIKAKTHYQNYEIPAAHELCLKAIRKDPLCFEILPIYVTCLLDLGLTGDLYYCAHNLVENYSTHPVSWFSVGTYYFHCKKFEVARKYFQKAIMLDRSFLYAWVGMAHSFAVQD
jgi:anaphase-promoting complex subunit 6